MKSTKNEGFTLVELMVVVAILGILVAVAIPVYNAVTGRAARSTCETNRVNATRFYHMARATDNGSIAGQMNAVLTATLGGTETSTNHYSGLCPSGGEFVVTTGADGIDSIRCTVHGSELSEDTIQNSIKDNLDILAGLDAVKDYFAGKSQGQISSGVSLDSEANHEAAVAPDILAALEKAGVNIKDSSWRIYFRDNANKKDYNFFWTEPNIKDMAPGTEITVTKYDALTGKYYTGTATVGKHKDYSFNIIDASNTKDWTEFTP